MTPVVMPIHLAERPVATHPPDGMLHHDPTAAGLVNRMLDHQAAA